MPDSMLRICYTEYSESYERAKAANETVNRIVESNCNDPAWNLALEETIMNTQGCGVSMYLWQNQNTVVIGRNQNAWKECRVALLERENGTLARRSSGGGAVFHDLGNLNFSFVADPDSYDVARQLSVLTGAVSMLGLKATVSGRNDVTLTDTGEKFSGNAFQKTDCACLHHGTVLIDTDMDKLARYLAPSPEKLAAKGVESVRARVTNLASCVPGLDADRMKRAMLESFHAVYGDAERCDADRFDKADIEALHQKYASWEWRFGKTPRFDLALSHRFDWGEAELLLTFAGGCVAEARLYTDSMDETLSESVERLLAGARCDAGALSERISGLHSPQANALALWLAQQIL